MSKIVTVNLPDIGEGVIEGEVIEWLKEVGDPLRQDEPVVIVMTDKATVELPAPYPGKLAKQYFQPGEIAILGKPLYDIAVEGEELPVKEEKKKEIEKEAIIEKPKPSHVRHIPTGEKVLATPPTRKLAKELGVDINRIHGTGKDGRVTIDDLKRSYTTEPTPPWHLPMDEEQPVIGIRGLMAKKTAESKRIIPHFSYFEKVEATRLIQLRQNVKKEAAGEGVKVTFMPFFIRALSLTIQHFPIANSSYDLSSNRLILHKQQNIGIAMSTQQGLIVPVLKNVQELSLEQIIRAFEMLKEKAATNQLQSSDMKESTITISNYGVLGGGGYWATPVISHPEVAILAVNRIQKQPIVKNNQVVPCDILNLSWSFDHRVIDGDLAANVSHHFTTLIQNPASML
ncbi:MAG: Lipoamide acyltransferase component of branched-chain alpha-keto acid dehydrogenase complex [Chlamydiae bacterium]|nr:Lipoamide acyltransferase component of branched-chain alpha-keto acid dehydrogenase complex [Chlamydiota bacterium]